MKMCSFANEDQPQNEIPDK